MAEFNLGNVHKGRPTIFGHFGHTYLPMSDFSILCLFTYVRFLLRYLPTPKADILYGLSLGAWRKLRQAVKCDIENICKQ